MIVSFRTKREGTGKSRDESEVINQREGQRCTSNTHTHTHTHTLMYFKHTHTHTDVSQERCTSPGITNNGERTYRRYLMKDTLCPVKTHTYVE